MKLVKFIRYFLLLGIALSLLGLTAYDWYSRSITVFILILILGLFLIYVVLSNYKESVNSEPWELKKIDWHDFLFAYFAAIFTYNLTMYDQVSSVLSSALVGLVGGTIFKNHDKAMFAGSFLGMAAGSVFGAWGFVLASLVMAFVFVFTKPIYQGVGGKLGTIAFTGAIISYLITDITPTVGITFSITEGLYLVIASVVGAILTRVISNVKDVTIVQASSVVGLLFVVFFDYETYSLSPYIALCGFGASFVGMSSKHQMKNIFIVGIGGLLFGVLFYLESNLFGGFGGKLGTTAFISSLVVIGLTNLIPLKLKKPIDSSNQMIL